MTSFASSGSTGSAQHWAGKSDAVLSLLPHLADHDADAGKPVDRAALFAAMHTLVTSLSSGQLLCIFVDDLHWVDASSLDLITFLATVSTHAQLLIMCTVRSNPDETARIAQQLTALSRVAGSRAITLTPLSADEVAAQAIQYLGPGADRELVERVQRLSDGVPLFVEELLATGEAAMSTTLRLGLEGRLSGLADDTLRYLQAAAVGEGHAGTGPLMSVSGLDRIAAASAHREASSRGLLEPESGASGVRFHHALQREAVLNTLMPSELQELHRLWAVQIETGKAGLSSDEATTVCAAHWVASGDTDRALRAALEAAQTARRRGGFAEYPLWQQRALTLWDSASDPEKLTGSTRDHVLIKTIASLVAHRALGRGEVTGQHRTREPTRRPARRAAPPPTVLGSRRVGEPRSLRACPGAGRRR